MNIEADTLKHIARVGSLLHKVMWELLARASEHDATKLDSPEKEMYEIWRPKLDALDIKSQEYKDALLQIGIGLTHHYLWNRHHPEHFENGISGMNLMDVTEMVCDWIAAAERTGKKVDLDWACERFGIAKGGILYYVIQNTIVDLQK